MEADDAELSRGAPPEARALGDQPTVVMAVEGSTLVADPAAASLDDPLPPPALPIVPDGDDQLSTSTTELVAGLTVEESRDGPFDGTNAMPVDPVANARPDESFGITLSAGIPEDLSLIHISEPTRPY